MDIVIMLIREPGDLNDQGEQNIEVEVVGQEDWPEADRMAWVEKLQATGQFGHFTFVVTKMGEPFLVPPTT